MKYFEKSSVKKDEYGITTDTFGGMLERAPKRLIPFVGKYLSTEGSVRKNNPMSTYFLGRPGALGALSKNTDKSYLINAMAPAAITGAAVGGIGGGVLGSIALSEDLKRDKRLIKQYGEEIAKTKYKAGGKLKYLYPLLGIIGGGTALGLLGATGSASRYGLGFAFGGKRTPEDYIREYQRSKGKVD